MTFDKFVRDELKGSHRAVSRQIFHPNLVTPGLEQIKDIVDVILILI